MFQYHVEECVFRSKSFSIFHGRVKSSKEEIEITTINKSLHKQNAHQNQIEKFLKSNRHLTTAIDVFSSKIFPSQNNNELSVYCFNIVNKCINSQIHT